MPTDCATATWEPAHSDHYQVSPTRPASSIKRVIIHDMQGTYANSIGWFAISLQERIRLEAIAAARAGRPPDPQGVSCAHYLVNSSTGEITQMLRENQIAYHAGNLPYNRDSIGIEHEGWWDDEAKARQYYTDKMYETSAKLVRDICQRNGIPLDRDHIIGHNEVPNPNQPGGFGGSGGKRDPGSFWDWDRYMALVRGEQPTAAVLVRLEDANCFATPPQLIVSKNWHLLPQPGPAGRQLYTITTDNPSLSTNSIMWTPNIPQAGNYAVAAYIPFFDNGTPDCTAAIYTIVGAGEPAIVTANQAATTASRSGGWLPLGTFALNQGSSNTVHLIDLSNDPQKTVWFAAMRFTPVPLASTTTDHHSSAC